MRYALKAIVGLLAFSVVVRAGAQEAVAPAAQPEPNAVAGNVRIDACASDPSRLGLSRVVEIDTTGGPKFGGEKGHANDFLKDGEVVLTFDDGPMRHSTRAVLKALADQCTKATFFMVGRMAASDPAMVKEVANAGHTVATHTWSHKNLRANNLIKGRQEFEMGFSAVTRALGAPVTPFFRFPYLGDNRQVGEYLKTRNISSWWVDVDSKDYTSRDPQGMQRRVMDGLATKRKGIILMHDIQPATVNGIKGLLDELHAKGFKVVHIVPKAATDTIADYDASVEKAFKSRTAAAAANPLADRSVLWNADSPKGKAGATAGEPTAGTSKRAPAASQKPTTVNGAGNLPWLDVNSSKGASQPPAPAPAATDAPKPKKPSTNGVEVLPWQPSTFGY
ncbi:MAG: polysaccharide deacetylase family protein [Hyphomicrobium sp.]|nr:polysaccharide deacetylase family protein [Hyphomicrobium sp.]